MAIAEKDVLLKERIKYLLVNKKTTINRIADSDTERIRLSRQINGDQTLVTFDTIYKILYMFPDISAEWLVRGEGTMTRSGEGAPRFYTTNNVHDNHAGGDINVGPEVHTSKQIKELQHKLDEVTADRDLLKKLLDAMTTTTQVRKKPAK